MPLSRDGFVQVPSRWFLHGWRENLNAFFLQDGFVQVPLRWCLHGRREILPDGLRPLGLLDFAEFFTSCGCVEGSGAGAGGVVAFARLLPSCQKLLLSPFEHCPLACHCQHSPCLLWTRRCSLWFFTNMFNSILPILASKFRDLKFCSRHVFTIVFSLWWSSFVFLLMNLHVVQFQHGLDFVRLSYS